MKRNKHESDWSDLPKELLDSIQERLNTRSDVARFQAVCKNFRPPLPRKPKRRRPASAFQIPLPITPVPGHTAHLKLIKSSIFAIQAFKQASNGHALDQTTKTWIVKVKKSKTGRLQVMDPLSRKVYRSLSKDLPKSLNLLDYQVADVTKAYGLQVVTTGPKCKPSEVVLQQLFTHKVVVTSNIDEGDDKFALLAICGISPLRHLALWRNQDQRWIHLVDSKFTFWVDDIIYYNHKFYAVGSAGITVAIEYECSNVNVTTVAAPQRKFRRAFEYLVKSCDNLYMVVKHWSDEYPKRHYKNYFGEYYPIRLEVYKLDEKKRTWVPVEKGLQEHSFFVGADSSFSISSRMFPGCKANCVYFTDGEFSESDRQRPGWYDGIYNLEDDTVASLSTVQGYSKIFWPPPSWLN